MENFRFGHDLNLLFRPRLDSAFTETKCVEKRAARVSCIFRPKDCKKENCAR